MMAHCSRWLFLVIAIVAVLSFMGTGASESWSSETNLTSEEWLHWNDVSADGDEVHVIWLEGTETNWPPSKLYHKWFDGTDWHDPKNIYLEFTSGSYYSMSASIEASDGTVHLIYARYRLVDSKGRGDIYYRTFDQGRWSSELELSTYMRDNDQWDPDMAVEGKQVYVVWEDLTDDWTDIHFSMFDGQTWSDPIEISIDVNDTWQRNPAIAVKEGIVHVVWEDYCTGSWTLVHRSFNGTAWGNVTDVQSLNRNLEVHADIAASNGTCHVVWDENYGINYRRLYDGNWSSIQLVGLNQSSIREYVYSIAVIGDYPFITWHVSSTGTSSGDHAVYLRWFDGDDWTAPLKVGSRPGSRYLRYPNIATSKDMAHIVWNEQNASGENWTLVHRSASFDTGGPSSQVEQTLRYWHHSRNVTLNWSVHDDFLVRDVSLY